MRHQKEARRAAQFLAQNRKNDELFGYELTTVLGASLFSRLGENTQIKNIEKKAQKIIEKEKEPAFLNWYIETLESSTLSYKEALIEKSLEKLQRKLEEITFSESVNGER